MGAKEIVEEKDRDNVKSNRLSVDIKIFLYSLASASFAFVNAFLNSVGGEDSSTTTGPV